MADSGQGYNPYGREYSHGENENTDEGYSGYDYTGHAETTDAYYTSGNYSVQTQQPDATFAQYSTPEGWQQPTYDGGATYGADQYGFPAGSSVQRPSTPAARGYTGGGEHYEFHTTIQHMMPATGWTSHTPQSTTQYWSGSQDASGNADVFTTGSVRPSQDQAPYQNRDEDDYPGVSGEMDLDDDSTQTNYGAPVNTKNLPAPVPFSEQVKEKSQTELEKRKEEIEEKVMEAAMEKFQEEERRFAERQKEEARRRSIKASNIKALERYRDKKSWDEIYLKEKERITRGINEESKEILTSLQNEKKALLKSLKNHSHKTCKCDAVHQYLFFTGESRHITREEAYGLGWLTAEELKSLQCHSPQHSPSKKSSSSGKSGSSPGSRNDGSPPGKNSGKGKGKGNRKGGGKGHKR